MISPMQLSASGKKAYMGSDVHIQGPDVELHPNLVKASFHIFQVRIVYRTRQIKKAKEAFGSRVKPISAACPEFSPGTTRRHCPDWLLKGV